MKERGVHHQTLKFKAGPIDLAAHTTTYAPAALNLDGEYIGTWLELHLKDDDMTVLTAAEAVALAHTLLRLAGK